MSDIKDGGAVIDRMFAALASGDIEAGFDCMTEDAVTWHSFDCVEMDREAIRAGWQALIDGFSERGFVDVRRDALGGGRFLQRHVMTATTASGQRKAWPVCLVVKVEEGRIARLDEYIDRAGSFEPASGDVKTPGLSE